VRAQAEADYAIDIASVSLELAPGRIVQTVGYNGTVPAPILRLCEGRRTTITVTNRTNMLELVHWHGLVVPPVVDGAMEEGTWCRSGVSRAQWCRRHRLSKSAFDRWRDDTGSTTWRGQPLIVQFRFPKRCHNCYNLR